MRWQVYGTDPVTGQQVVLAVDEPEKRRAVKAALDRQILVSHVTRERGELWKRIRPWLLGAGLVAFLTIGVALLVENIVLRANLDQLLLEQMRLASSMAQAENLVNQLRQNGTLAGKTAISVDKLADDLAAARSNMSLTEEQLSAAREQMNKLERTAGEVPQLQAQLASAAERSKESEAEITRQKTELATQSRQLEELQKTHEPPAAVMAKIESLERTNKELTSQMDLLKGQLLVAAAVSTMPRPELPSETELPPQITSSWALRMPYDAAKDFVAFHFDRETLASTSTGDGRMATAGARPDNAASIRFIHDRQKERVYSATLSVSLGSAVPKDKRAENIQLVVDFTKAFAPTLHEPENALTTAAAQLPNADATRRLVLLGDDYKLTIWNSGAGLFTLKVQSPHDDLEQ